MKEKICKTLTIIATILLILFILIFNYNVAKSRVQRFYKIENPTFTDVMLEIYKRN